MNLKKITFFLLFLTLLFGGLYFTESIFVPFLFAVLLAMLLRPVADFLEDKNMNRIASSTLAVLFFFLIMVGISIILLDQLGVFVDDLPQLQSKLMQYLRRFQQFIENKLGIPYQQQIDFLEEQSKEFSDSAQQFMQNTMAGMMNFIVDFLIVHIYLFLLLLNRRKYYQFFKKIAPGRLKDRSTTILQDVTSVSHHYLWGRIKVMSILAVMYVMAFLIFDVKYLILLTIFGSIITIIPYLGPFISGLLPIIVVILTGEPISTIIIFTLLIVIIQLIESYVLEPVIIGSEVNLNPLTIILIIVVGNAVWGIAGMILFVPLLSMLKIFMDNIDELKPYGELIGSNTTQSNSSFKSFLKKIKPN